MYIHIGLPKAASTWLQDYVMGNADLGFCRPKIGSDLMKAFVYEHGFDFDAAAVRAMYDAHRDDQPNTVSWLSYERLAGIAASGGYDTKEIADRIAAVFPEAKVLIVIREQKSIILSNYKQSIKAGGVAPLAAYLNTPKPHVTRPMPRFSFKYFEYHRLIAYYQQLIGVDNVLVLPYEFLQEDPRAFVTRIVTFADMPEPSDAVLDRIPFDTQPRSARGPIETYLKRYISAFFAPRNDINPNALFPSEFLSKGLTFVVRSAERYLVPSGIKHKLQDNLKSRVAQSVGDYYRESNRKTQDLTGLDLSRYGYDL